MLDFVKFPKLHYTKDLNYRHQSVLGEIPYWKYRFTQY